MSVRGDAEGARRAAEHEGQQGEPAPAGGTAGAPATSPFAKRGAIYTMTAREGLDAAEVVKAAFRNRTIGAITPRRLEVVEPDGPSTSGGKRARQTIRLVTAQGEGAPVMCGFLDVAKKLVELRSYTAVAQQYAERFDKPFDVTPSEYAALCKDLESTLAVFRYEFVREVETRPAADGVRAQLSSRAKPRGRVLNVVLVLSLTAVVAGLLATIVLR